MATGKRRRSGRPTRYDPQAHPLLAGYLARDGATAAQMAKELGIAESTLNRWQAKYPEFREAIKGNGRIVDWQVEDSLLKRAMGYEVPQVEQTFEQPRRRANLNDPEERQLARLLDGESVPIVQAEPVLVAKKVTVKHIPPDPTSAIFWLKNRQPAKWRDKPAADDDGGAEKLDALIAAMEAAARAAAVQP